MRIATMTVLNQDGVATGDEVSGRITVAQRPQAWEVPEYLDPGTLPSHTLMCRSGGGVAARRQLVDEDGRKFLVLGRADVTVSQPDVDYWWLKVL